MSWAKGRARRSAWLPLARDGVTALEFALVAPMLFMMLLGTVELGRWYHTQSTLQSAVEAAARCAAVDKITCGTDALIKAYAANRAPGKAIQASTFTTAKLACGRQVSASLNFALSIPYAFSKTLPITAVSCHPS